MKYLYGMAIAGANGRAPHSVEPDEHSRSRPAIPVMLSAAKNLPPDAEILRCAQHDSVGFVITIHQLWVNVPFICLV